MVKIYTTYIIYIIYTSFSWGHHIHYDLEFRGFSVGDSRRFAWKHKESYCSFGTVAVALELIPIFNLLFMWTNVVGAALWVGDKYEKNEREIARRNRSSSNEYFLHPGRKDSYGSV